MVRKPTLRTPHVPLFSHNPGGIEGYWSAKAVASGQPEGCGSHTAIGAGEGDEIPDLYRELARSSNLMEELQRAESEDAWIKAGVGQLYKDLELRRFLQGAREIPAAGEMVRHWIRVAEAGRAE